MLAILHFVAQSAAECLKKNSATKVAVFSSHKAVSLLPKRRVRKNALLVNIAYKKPFIGTANNSFQRLSKSIRTQKKVEAFLL